MNKFMLNITASSGEFYQGDCEDLVLPTGDGVYGVQAGHNPVLVAIHMGILHFEVNGEARDILVGDGIAEVTPAYVMVLVDSAERPEDIDKNRAEAARIRAEERLQHQKSMNEYYQSQMLHWFKGMHLQLSLGGDYVRKQRKEWREHPIDFDKIPFYELFRLAYDHACHIDLHQPFIGEGVRKFVERVAPKYVTLEYQQNSREEYEQFVEAQSKILKWITIH